ncbi:MAG: hypothetical protein LBH98_00845 [Chitinispirillales bacterium]|jgi:hypothetical protein|nr:hypothetical protein [Chitinispirillales bacterium]
MKKFLLMTLFLFCASVMAHGVLLLVEDNKDGTIYIEAGISTGGNAEGASVILKEKASGKTIFTSKIPAEGHLNVEQPKIPYTVTVHLSEGHEITKNGPLAGEDKENADNVKNETNKQTPQDKSKKGKK